MKTQYLLATLGAVACLVASASPSPAADAPSISSVHAPLDAEAVLRKVELNVGLKNYEKVLAAKFEAEFELQLGPPDSTLSAEQKVAWTEAQARKRDVLTKMAGDLREQIKEWIAAENSVAQAKGELKEGPKPIIIDRPSFDLNDPHSSEIDHDDRTPSVPRNVHGALANAEAKSTPADRLKVVVKPAVATVHPNEFFKAALRVENPTKETQTIKVMNCGWFDHWKSDNPHLALGGVACEKNFAEDVEIAPGEAYAKELDIQVAADTPPGKLSFRLIFTPIGSQVSYLSEPVELEVVAGENK